MSIEILNYRRLNGNSKIGQLDIRVWLNGTQWIIRRINHFQNGTKKWFGYSNFKNEEDLANVHYLPYAELATKVHNTQLFEALHELVEKYCLENKIAEIPPLDMSIHKDAVEELPF